MEETPNINLEWALYYLKLGLPIFPVSSTEKIPLVKWGEFQKRLPTEQEIREWWKQWPDADIGMPTGKLSNRLVLDIDSEEGQKYIETKGLEETLTVKTSRGNHYHFMWPWDDERRYTTVTHIFPGVDIRGTGGYVKLPPSKTNSGFYTWKEFKDITQILPAPKWLVELLESQKEEKQIETKQVESHWLDSILQGVGEGERHSALVKLAGYYYNFMPPTIAGNHLREWNKKNRPPIDSAELEEQIKSFNQDFTRDSEPIRSRQLEILTASELIKTYSGKIDWLVDHLIPKATTTIFSAWQGRGKSFVATDLAIEISRKRGLGKWMNTFDIQHGSVVYIDNENSPHLDSFRIQDLLKGKNLTASDINLYYLTRNSFKFTNENHRMQLQKIMEQVRPVLVIVDSFASNHTLDENASADMRHFFDDLVAPIADQFKCAFMFIDHERKDETTTFGGKRLRGSGAKGDAVDQIISLNEKDGMLIFENPKSRYNRHHSPFVVDIQGDLSKGFVIKNMGYIQQ